MSFDSVRGNQADAGAVTRGGSQQTAPANFQRTAENSMAASIIRLEQENQELRAEVALLREEQRILAKGFPSPAKAAVIEGGTGYSGVERPEPPPQFSDTPGTNAQLTAFTSISKLKKHFVNHTGTVSAEFARKLERERDEALLTVEGLRDQLCADKCRDKAAADGGWANI